MILTRRERDTLQAIVKLTYGKPYPPTVREIANEIEASSTSTHKYMNSLEEKGYIKREESKPRALQVINHVG